MKSKFLALAIATAALNVFAPAVGQCSGLHRQWAQGIEGRGAVPGLLQRPEGQWVVRRIWHLAELPMRSRPLRRPAPSAGMSSTCSSASEDGDSLCQ